jgi:hypothetical protein
MDCGECGENVAVRQRHTFVDCALYLAKHYPGRLGRYGPAMAGEIVALRSLLRDWWAADGGPDSLALALRIEPYLPTRPAEEHPDA